MSTRRSNIVLVKRAGVARKVSDGALLKAMRCAFDHHVMNREAEAEVSAARALIEQRAREFIGAERGGVVIEAGDLRLSVTPRYEAVIPPERLAEARRLLGRRFPELVRLRQKHVARRELLDLPEAAGIAEVKSLSPQFRWGV